MPIDPRTAALTVINEALSTFSYEPMETIETDDLTMQAIDALMEARDMLTDKPWPESPPRYLDARAFEAWHSVKAAEQRQDGRQHALPPGDSTTGAQLSAQRLRRTLLRAACWVVAIVALATVAFVAYAFTEDSDSRVCKEHWMCGNGGAR